MKAYFITFRSVTFAQRGESVLRRHGISCALQRTPKWMEERGCGYCIRISPKDARQVMDLFDREQVSYRKIYIQHTDGTMEELLV